MTKQEVFEELLEMYYREAYGMAMEFVGPKDDVKQIEESLKQECRELLNRYNRAS